MSRILKRSGFEVTEKQKKVSNKKGLYVWSDILKETIEKKKKLYLKWLTTKDPDDRKEYRL